MRLAGIVGVVCLKAPCSAAIDRTVTQLIFLGVCFVAVQNFASEKHRRHFKRQTRFWLEVVRDFLEIARHFDVLAAFQIDRLKCRILAIGRVACIHVRTNNIIVRHRGP
jgi:hypothetical protein